MRNVTIFTKTRLTSEKVSEELFKDFPGKKVEVQNDQSQLMIGKYPRNLNICFDNDSIDDPLQFVCKEFEKQIPFEPIFINEVEYHDPLIMVYALEKILFIYDELHVYDGESGFIGKASELIARLTN